MKWNYYPKLFALVQSLLWTSILGLSAGAQQSSVPPPNADAQNSDSADQAVVLSPFEVNASSNVGYGATSTSSASRVAQNYIDVPQTVNVVTSEYINDFNIQDQRRLLQYVPDVAITQGQTVYVRGAPLGASYIDGVVTGLTLNRAAIQFYDRVEIVKGPSSAAFGLGEPAGIINYISKTPTGGEKATATFGYGDHENYLFNFDVQGRSVSFNNVSYRLVGLFDHGYGHTKNTTEAGDMGVQLALRDDFNSSMSAQLIVSYARTIGQVNADQAYWFTNSTGLDFLAALGLPRPPTLVGKNTDLTSGGWGNEVTTFPFRANLILDKSLWDGHLNIHNSLVVESEPYDFHYANIDNIYNPSPGVWLTGEDRYRAEETLHSFSDNVDAEANFNVAGIKFKTLAGADYRQTASFNNQYGPPDVNPDGTLHTINIYNPDLSPLIVPTAPITAPNGTVIAPVIYYGESFSKSFQYGFYVQQEAKFFSDKVALMAGWRIDHSFSSNQNTLYHFTTRTGWQSSKGAPRYAITVKPVKWLSAYALYTEHNDPANLVSQFVETVPGHPTPETLARYNNFQNLLAVVPFGQDIEFGVKSSLLNDKLTLSACVFHEIVGGAIQNITTIIPDPDGSVTQVVTNIPVSNNIHGYEFEIFGQPTRRLSFIANLGFTTGVAGNSTPAAPIWVHPPSTISCHGKLDLGDLSGNGFYVTFGGIRYGTFWMNQVPYVYYNSVQYSFDAGLGYRWNHGRQSVNFNVDNVADASIDVGFQGNGYVSQPREQAFVTYTWRFK